MVTLARRFKTYGNTSIQKDQIRRINSENCDLVASELLAPQLAAQLAAVDKVGSQVTVEHVDADGDRSVFSIEDGALMWYVNDKFHVVVTELKCKRSRRKGLFTVKDQNDLGSTDFTEGVVRSLKEMATMAGVNLVGDGWSSVRIQVAAVLQILFGIDMWEIPVVSLRRAARGPIRVDERAPEIQ